MMSGCGLGEGAWWEVAPGEAVGEVLVPSTENGWAFCGQTPAPPKVLDVERWLCGLSGEGLRLC